MTQGNQERSLLRSLLRGECAAFDCYLWLHSEMKSSSSADRDFIYDQARHHETRARKIHSLLEAQGEEPPFRSGVWGALTLLALRLVFCWGNSERGWHRAFSLLREGEEFGLCQYQSVLPEFSVDLRIMLENNFVLPQALSFDRVRNRAKGEQPRKDALMSDLHCSPLSAR